MRAKRIRLRTAISILLLVLLCCGTAIGAFSAHEQKLNQIQEKAVTELKNHKDGYDERCIVLEDTTPERAAELAERFDATLRMTQSGTNAILTLPEGQSVEQIFTSRAHRAVLEELTPDYIYTADDWEEANDAPAEVGWPDYNVSDTDYAKQINLKYVNLSNLWGVTKGEGADGTKVRVAVIDTGIDTDHTEFLRNGVSIVSTASYNSVTNKTVANAGWSAIEDDYGHGTAVSGVIAAQMNGTGVAGIAPDVELLVIKANITDTKSFSRSALVAGVDYAVAQGADVINMSLSGAAAYGTSYFKNVADQGVIVVASAGNDSNDELHYPAADPYTIGVGALAYNSWSLADFSCYGKNTDLVAPGASIYTAAKGGGYAYISGTSFSCPTVAAAVALYIAYNNHTSFAQLKADLLGSCLDLGTAGKDETFGYGALDIHRFVRAAKGTVTFEYRASDMTSTSQRVVLGESLRHVPIPEDKTDMVFEGWYFDAACTQKFTSPMYYTHVFEESTTLYARWVGASSGVFDYRVLNSGTLEIIGYRGTQNHLEIPAELDGKSVTSVGIEAMKDLHYIRSVTIPSSVTSVGTNAFDGCSALRAVYVHSAVVARSITDINAMGGLCRYATGIAVARNLGTPANYVRNTYAYNEIINVDETAYVLYSKHESSWQISQVLEERVACQQDGLADYACSDCGVVKRDIIPKHDAGDWQKILDESCTVDGLLVRRCTTCRTQTHSQIVFATGHTPAQESTLVPPGCEERGYTQYSCVTCHQQYAENYTNATGHTPGEWERLSAPTKELAGERAVFCTVCRDMLQSEPIAALIHLKDFELEVNRLEGLELQQRFSSMQGLLEQYADFSAEERAVVAQDYERLAGEVRAYNAYAQERNDELGRAGSTATDMLSSVYEALCALWYAWKDKLLKGE